MTALQALSSPDGICTTIKGRDHKCDPKCESRGHKCGARAIKGSMVCRKHGGSLPNVKAAGQFRIARDKAQQEVLKRLREEKADRIDTVTEMDRLAAEVITWKDVCRERLDFVLEHEQIRYEGKTGEQLRAEVVLYTQALDRCNTVLATNVKLNIAERRVELDKAKAIMVAAVIRGILARLELTTEQQQRAPRIIQEEMLALSAEVG